MKIFLGLLAFFITSSAFAQSDAPLSFDKDKVPFSTIGRFVYRGSDFYYHSLLAEHERASRFDASVRIDVTDNSRIVSAPLRGTRFSPVASKGLVSVQGGLKSKGNNLGQAEKIEPIRDGDLIGMAYWNWRSYSYYDYKLKDSIVTDTVRYKEAQLDASMSSGVVGLGVGRYNEYFTPSIVVTYFYEKHTSAKSGDLDSVGLGFRYLYKQRVREVSSRLDETGFETKNKFGVAFIGYSPRFRSGVIVSPDYFEADIHYANVLSGQGVFPFSQASLNIIRTVRLFTKNPLLKSINFVIQGNFEKAAFHRFSNLMSSAGYRYSFWPIEKLKSYALVASRFDHTHGRFASFDLGVQLWILGCQYQYTNPKVFAPDLERLYRHSIRLYLKLEGDIQ